MNTDIEFTDVSSSNIKKIAFKENKIYIVFNSGKCYSYDGDEKLYEQFKNSDSKGKFFYSNIKTKPFILEKLD